MDEKTVLELFIFLNYHKLWTMLVEIRKSKISRQIYFVVI